MLKVFKNRCKNCLMGKSRIVSPQRAAGILKKCQKEQNHFICHKDNDTICAGFFQKMGEISQMVRICGRMNYIEFVEHEPHEKLLSYEEAQESLKKFREENPT